MKPSAPSISSNLPSLPSVDAHTPHPSQVRRDHLRRRRHHDLDPRRQAQCDPSRHRPLHPARHAPFLRELQRQARRILCLQTPGIMGPEYYFEIAAHFHADGPNVAGIAAVMSRYGVVPVAQTNSLDACPETPRSRPFSCYPLRAYTSSRLIATSPRRQFPSSTLCHPHHQPSTSPPTAPPRPSTSSPTSTSPTSTSTSRRPPAPPRACTSTTPSSKTTPPPASRRRSPRSTTYEKKIEAIDPSALDATVAADREILLNNIRSQLLTLEVIRPWEKNPDTYSSGVTNSIFVIMERPYASGEYSPARRRRARKADPAGLRRSPQEPQESAAHLHRDRPRTDRRRSSASSRTTSPAPSPTRHRCRRPRPTSRNPTPP